MLDFKTIADFRRDNGTGIRNVCRRFVELCRELKLFSQATREEHGLQIRRYWTSACPSCPMKAKCTPSDYRRVSRWEHEPVLEAGCTEGERGEVDDENPGSGHRACGAEWIEGSLLTHAGLPATAAPRKLFGSV